MQMSYVAQLQISSVLQIPCHSSSRSAQLRSEGYTTLKIKTIARLHKHRIAAFIRLYVTCVQTGNDLMRSISEHLTRVIFLFARARAYTHERKQVPYLIIRQALNHSQLIQRLERMFVRIHQNLVYLLRRKKIELLQLFVRGVIQIDRLFVKRIQIGLQLFVVHLADLRCRIVYVQNDVVQRGSTPLSILFYGRPLGARSSIALHPYKGGRKEQYQDPNLTEFSFHGAKLVKILHMCKKSSNFAADLWIGRCSIILSNGR